MFSAVRFPCAFLAPASGRIVVFLMALSLPLPLRAAQPTTAPEEPPKRARTLPGVVVVRFCDSSSMKMTLREETVAIITRYGKFRIPVAEIQQIEFATHIAADVQKRIDAAIANLGHAGNSIREAADAELQTLGEHAYHALVKAARSSDAEVVKRATALLEKIRESIPEEMLTFRPHDVIHTSDASKFIGRIDAVLFKASTTAFGDVALKFPGVHSLRVWGLEPEIEIAKLPPAPANMSNEAGMIGKTFVYRVTGANVVNGLWGTDVYTADSSVATVAVHAGIVKVGETGLIRVTIVPALAGYASSERNGVRSIAHGAFPGAYQVSK